MADKQNKYMTSRYRYQPIGRREFLQDLFAMFGLVVSGSGLAAYGKNKVESQIGAEARENQACTRQDLTLKIEEFYSNADSGEKEVAVFRGERIDGDESTTLRYDYMANDATAKALNKLKESGNLRKNNIVRVNGNIDNSNLELIADHPKYVIPIHDGIISKLNGSRIFPKVVNL